MKLLKMKRLRIYKTGYNIYLLPTINYYHVTRILEISFLKYTLKIS
jgi:hypothetical protein